jgi:hypothetical protein
MLGSVAGAAQRLQVINVVRAAVAEEFYMVALKAIRRSTLGASPAVPSECPGALAAIFATAYRPPALVRAEVVRLALWLKAFPTVCAIPRVHAFSIAQIGTKYKYNRNEYCIYFGTLL